jgi:hypothetical protein
MKSYFPKAPVDVVAGGLTVNCSDDQYKELLEQMMPNRRTSRREAEPLVVVR